MKELKKKLVRKQVISLLLIAVVIAVSAITIVFSNNRQTIFSRASDHDLGGDCPWPNTCGPPDGCNSWEKCINGVCHDTTNGGKNSPSDDSCGGTGQPDPAAPECFSPDKCVGGRWCGDDGKFKDKLNDANCSGGIAQNPVGDCIWTCGNGFGCAKQSDVDHFKNVYGQYALKEWLIEACGIAVQPTAAQPTAVLTTAPTARPPTVPSSTPECQKVSCSTLTNNILKQYSLNRIDGQVLYYQNSYCGKPNVTTDRIIDYCKEGVPTLAPTARPSHTPTPISGLGCPVVGAYRCLYNSSGVMVHQKCMYYDNNTSNWTTLKDCKNWEACSETDKGCYLSQTTTPVPTEMEFRSIPVLFDQTFQCVSCEKFMEYFQVSRAEAHCIFGLKCFHE